MNEVITIAPRLAPAVDGVGDYARLLAKQMYQDFGIETYFIVGDPTWAGNTRVEGFPVEHVKQRTAQDLVTALSAQPTTTVLLHYVGYGYAKRGCPTWLVDGLERWLQGDKRRHLVTMFHELYASGPLWSSAFWLSSLQKRLVARLAKLSHRVLTNSKAYAALLSQISKKKHQRIPALPVFSTVGEPDAVLPLRHRLSQVIVFGSKGKRAWLYQDFQKELAHACRNIQIERIIDIGPLTGMNVREVEGIPVTEVGVISAVEITDILGHSLAGYLVGPAAYLAKSTIFAAYCAHGVLPILPLSNNGLEVDGLVLGQQYIGPLRDGESAGLDRLEVVARNAHSWYAQHNLRAQSAVFAENL